MGTQVTLIIDGTSEDLKEAFKIIEEVEQLMSDYNPKSEISLLNRKGESKVSPWTKEVIRKAIEFSRITKGAFDITVGPLVDLWKKAEREKKVPTQEELKKVCSLVGYKNILVEDDKISFKAEGMRMDLGGIAKGYAVDKAIEVLRKRGVKNALVNAGGDIYCLGEGPRGKWRIGIQHPRQEREIVGIIRISNRGVATSGDYRRYYLIQGKRFGHIINPLTGWTVQDNPMSVTIIAPDATTADALATCVFVLGTEEGMDLINSLPRVEGMIIGEGMEVFTSKGWESYEKNPSNKSLGT